MEPDPVQITKVNWKNIQEYFKIFAKISPLYFSHLWSGSARKWKFLFIAFFSINHLSFMGDEEFIIFFFGLIFATFDDFIKFSQLNYKFQNQWLKKILIKDKKLAKNEDNKFFLLPFFVFRDKSKCEKIASHT